LQSLHLSGKFISYVNDYETSEYNVISFPNAPHALPGLSPFPSLFSSLISHSCHLSLSSLHFPETEPKFASSNPCLRCISLPVILEGDTGHAGRGWI